MKRKKAGVFPLLVGSYVVFALLLIASLILSLLATYALAAGSLAPLDPYALLDQPNGKAAQVLTQLGGWAEKLDSQYKILAVYGEKQDSQQSYTTEEIFQLLRSENTLLQSEVEQNPYRGMIRPALEEGQTYYYLVKIPRDAIAMQYSLVVTNHNASGTAASFMPWVVLVLFVGNCLLMSLYLSRKIQKPLLSISSGMQQIQEGTPGVQLDFKAQMEFEEIRDAFNYMSRQLDAEKQQRAASERHKNQLLLDLSHDIRTPLAIIKTYANALEQGLVAEDKQKSYLKTIDAKAGRVNDLAEDLFTLLKMDNPAYTLHIQPVDLAEVTRLVCAEFYEEIEQKGLQLLAEIPEGQLFVPADETLLKRVLANLISNAVKYNCTGKTVTVRLEPLGAGARLLVCDDGCLIPPSEQATMFHTFARGDKTRSSTGGSGLGLAISKAIVERLGGTLTYHPAQSQNCFEISL